MPSKLRVKRLEKEVKKFLNSRDAQIVKLRQNGAEQCKEDYFEAEDRLDEALDRLYSEKMMYLKENDENLFSLYLGKKKDQVKKILLQRIKKGMIRNLDLQRITWELEKLRDQKDKSKNKATIKEINKRISILEKKQERYE